MYLLDTDICIFMIRGKHPQLVEKIEALPAEKVFLSSVTHAELEFGVANSRDPDRNRTALELFASGFEILPFDTTHARIYGEIRAYLSRRGTPIGPYDLQIAAQALTHDYYLITNNISEFSRIPELKTEELMS
jgi:tRNA(fMet)-specific endonuclease VapC